MKLIKILSVLLIVLSSTFAVQAQQVSTPKPTIIFIHGIWADGSSFSQQITALQSKGYRVISVQNSLNTLADDVVATKRAIEQSPGKVILVGHSWGGFVISQAGHDAKVTALVYIAAFTPKEGENVPTLSANATGTEIGKYFVNTGGYTYLSEEGVQKTFAQDLSPQQQKLIFATQIPAAQALFSDEAGAPAWLHKANWYIVTKNDKALSPQLQRLMAKRINAKTTEIESGHIVMTSHPKEVLAVIEEAANQ